MTLRLYRTGQKVPFLEVSMGSAFFAHNAFWTRCDFGAATKLVATQEMGSTCNFIIDGTVKDRAGNVCEEVEIVTVNLSE